MSILITFDRIEKNRVTVFTVQRRLSSACTYRVWYCYSQFRDENAVSYCTGVTSYFSRIILIGGSNVFIMEIFDQ